MVIIEDSRENKNDHILQYFDAEGVKHIRSKLYAGDYSSLENGTKVVERKGSIQEICGNVCQGHERFIRELERAKEAEIQLTILVEDNKVKTLADVNTWYNPRLKTSPKATRGTTLFKILYSLQAKYDVPIEFCKKSESGKRILEILE